MLNFLAKNRINFDYASITPVDGAVLRYIDRLSKKYPANPNSLHKDGLDAKKILETARNNISKTLKCHKDEIVFTSGGTESNNIAIRGVIESKISEFSKSGKNIKDLRIITSKIEHSSVLEIFNYYKDVGLDVVFIEVDHDGVLDLKSLKNNLNKDTAIVSVMFVNNEIGSIQPVREIAKEIRHFNRDNNSEIIFHTDASQAFITENVDLNVLGVDLLTLDGSKVYGPRSTGILYVKRDTKIAPIIFGGGQEKGLRSGTENIANASGMALALNKVSENRDRNINNLTILSEYLIKSLSSLSKEVSREIRINCDGAVPHIKSIYFEGLDAEYLMFFLDARGISISTKSSCLRDEDESYVLKSLGLDRDKMLSTVRFSIGLNSNKRQINKFIKIVKECYTVGHGSLK
jgi:cysteine desulfurase